MAFDRSRRRFLGATATLAAVGLAGCGGDDDGNGNGNGNDDTDTEGGNGNGNGDTDTEGGNGTAQSHMVEMTDGLEFDPDSLTVAPGDEVVWKNVGDQGHSVTAYEDDIPDEAEYWASGGFDSEQAARDNYDFGGSLEETGNIPSGESWSRTFEAEGTHEYFCIPHEGGGMVGTIEVSSE